MRGAGVFRGALIYSPVWQGLFATAISRFGFLRVALWLAFFKAYGEHWLGVGLTVGLALVGIVLWGTLVGSMLPFVLRRFGLDPATSSAPFVATLVDVTGLIIYFSVAIVILPDRAMLRATRSAAVRAQKTAARLTSA